MTMVFEKLSPSNHVLYDYRIPGEEVDGLIHYDHSFNEVH